MLLVLVISNFPRTLLAIEKIDSVEALQELTLSDLENQLAQINARLGVLANPSMRTDVGAVGYRSLTHDDQNGKEWIQIELAEEALVDQIVLIPAIWRDTKTGYRADGFPMGFRVLVGTSPDRTGTEIARFSLDDHLLPRVAPVIVPCSQRISWVRLETTILSPRAWDGKHILQMSEIAIFEGEENVALNQTITASTAESSTTGARNLQYLVDGFVPYIMDAQHGFQSIAYLGTTKLVEQPFVSIDLESINEIDRIHLHAIDVSDTVPQTVNSDFGFPRNILIEGSLRPDFSDAVPLAEYEKRSIYNFSPIIILRFKATPCRYVRLKVLEPYSNPERDEQTAFVGFAEIELFSNGINVAQSKPASSNLESVTALRSVAALTDGHNLYGQILPFKLWLNQLAERHDLETLRPRITAELNRRYQRQAAYLNQLLWLVSLLGVMAIGAIVVGWLLRQRAVLKTREQIAADLHDELGANFHAIGLMTDLAQQNSHSPEKLKSLMQRIRDLTERTGIALRYCVNMLESKGLYDDLEHEMRRCSTRILAGIEHDLTIEGNDILNQLDQAKRISLYLFYKECLTNILRHSGASQVSTQLLAEENMIQLSVMDNGTGIETTSDNGIPHSLKRRAQLLGAKVYVQHPESGGTNILLTLHNRWRSFLSGLNDEKINSSHVG